MSSNSLASRSKPILPDLDQPATQSGLVVRKSSKFSPDGFLATLLSSVITGKASFNQLVINLKSRVGKSMSRQSLHERIGPLSTAFLVFVLCDLMKQRFEPVVRVLGKSAIRRIIIEDASGQVMPKSNSEDFPAHGNHHGPTAGVKVDLAYDLLSNAIISHSLHQATTQDKVIGKDLIAELRKGDLVLRDMGYFSLGEFTVIEDCGAWWLTRLPLTTGVLLEGGRKLEKHLRSAKGNTVDLVVLAGALRKKCRLVAQRAASEVAGSRRRARRATAASNGNQASPDAIIRDGWHLMLTNLNPAQASAAQLTEIYRARWAVEIQFRAWKQSLNLAGALNRKSGDHHIQALVLAAMIAHQLGMRMARVIGDRVGRACLSYEKLYDDLVDHLLQIHGLVTLDEFDPDARHVKRDKRKRKSPIESGILALT